MSRVDALPSIVSGFIIALGVLAVIVGVGIYIVASIIHLVFKQPKEETGAAIEGEYYPLMETGEMRETPARLPARRVLLGRVDDVPLIVRLYFTPTGRYGISKRTEFFSPFEYRGGRMGRFRLYPTGKEARPDLSVKERFARTFYLPEEDYESFRGSGLSVGAMEAILDFQEENGGVLSMDDRGLFWNIDRLDFGGLGSETAREFAGVSKIVIDSLEQGDGSVIGDSESVPEDLLHGSPMNVAGSSQPIYTTRKTLIGIVTALLLVGGLSLLGAILTYSGNREVFINLIAISIFTLIPGLIVLPILIYHIVTSLPASKPEI